MISFLSKIFVQTDSIGEDLIQHVLRREQPIEANSEETSRLVEDLLLLDRRTKIHMFIKEFGVFKTRIFHIAYEDLGIKVASAQRILKLNPPELKLAGKNISQEYLATLENDKRYF